MKTTYLRWPKSTWYVQILLDEDKKFDHAECMHVGDPERRMWGEEALAAMSPDWLRSQFEVASDRDDEIEELYTALSSCMLDFGIKSAPAAVAAVPAPVPVAKDTGLDLPEVW
jgi:hypothetical protein